MILIRPHPSSQLTCGVNSCPHPALKKVVFNRCNDGDEETKRKETEKDNSAVNCSTDNIFVERSPIRFKESAGAATIALDVAGFSSEDIQVSMNDFIVSIDGKRVNKLGDTFVIRRRFRVDKSTVLEDQVRAILSDGILEVVVPKKKRSGPRTIPISSQPVNELKEIETKNKKEDENDDDGRGASESDIAQKEQEQQASPSSRCVDDVETVDESEEDFQEDKVESKKPQPVAVDDSWEEVKE